MENQEKHGIKLIFLYENKSCAIRVLNPQESIKFTLIFLSFLLYSTSFAQTEFAPVGAEWFYTYDFGYCSNHLNRIFSEKDTIVDGNNCRLLKQYYDNSNSASEKYIMKQEQGKVYYYYKGIFNLLYDYGAEINDTINFSLMGKKYFFDNNQNPPFWEIDTVFSVRCIVESISIDAQNLRTFTTRILEEDRFDNYFPYMYKYTEVTGFHSEFILKINNEYYIPEYPPYRFLRCYSDAGFSFISDEWAATSLPCDYFKNIGINKLKEENINIYPNPFDNKISVFANNGVNITILDFLGKVIYCTKLSNGVNEISANHFPKGIYFAKIQGINNCHISKIVKL